MSTLLCSASTKTAAEEMLGIMRLLHLGFPALAFCTIQQAACAQDEFLALEQDPESPWGRFLLSTLLIFPNVGH